jgi:hypothetical protein
MHEAENQAYVVFRLPNLCYSGAIVGSIIWALTAESISGTPAPYC